MLLRTVLIVAAAAAVCVAQKCSDLKVSCNNVNNKDGKSSSVCTLVRKDKKTDAFDEGVCGCAPGGDYSVGWFDDSTQWRNFGSFVDTDIGDHRLACEDLYNEKDCKDNQFKNYLLNGEKSKDAKFFALKFGLKNTLEPHFNSFVPLRDGAACPGETLLRSGSLDFMRSDKCGSADGFNGMQKSDNDGYYKRNPLASGGSYAFVNSRSDCPQLRTTWDDWQGIVCRKNPTAAPSPAKPAPAPPASCKSSSDCKVQGPCGTASCKKGSCVYGVLESGKACNVLSSLSACDVADTCNGVSAECVDTVAANTKVCREATANCDVADTCNGVSAECVDTVAANTKVCREATADCDVAEYCTGFSKDCPKDVLAKSDKVCRAKNTALKCDVEEYCTGKDASCPKDGSLADCSEKAPSPPVVPPAEKKGKCKFDYNSDCVKCVSRKVGTSDQVVRVDLSACKDGEAISWFCCRNRNSWNKPSCSLQKCNGGKADGVTCSGATSADFVLGKSETTLKLQVHDGQLEGNVECKKGGAKSDGSSDCCGGGSGSCGVAVAEWTLNLNSCGVKPEPPTPPPKPPVPEPAKCPATCGACARCKVRPENDPKKVVVDFGGCGLPTSMDWASCLDAGCDASSCSGGSSSFCGNDKTRTRCQNVNEFVLTVAPSATSVNVQYSDGALFGSTTCGKSGCCGASSSSCGAATSVCNQEISLESCAECLEDSDCATSEETCEVAVCLKGSCQKKFLSEGTVCRYASGECEKSATCTGKSGVCGPNIPMNAGTPCRPSSGECDEDDYCDGKSSECPDKVIANCSPSKKGDTGVKKQTKVR